MELREVLPGRLHLIRFSVGQAYLWRDGDELTLVDTGPPGSAEDIVSALATLDLTVAVLRRVILTHWHDDHAGAAGELASSGVEVLAHRLDAPVVRGDEVGAPPVFTAAERVLHEQVASDLQRAAPSPVSAELDDGHEIDFGGGAEVIATPGHTDGSIALHLPAYRLIITGDTAGEHAGQVVLGPFNVERAQAVESMHRLGTIDADVAVFGHGDPVLSDARQALRSFADPFADPPG